MAFKDTIKHMRDLLTSIHSDLEKAEGGNKAASQRVRTGTVKLEKIAKHYRKESVATEKKTKGQKKPVAKKTAAKSKTKATTSKAKHVVAKSHAKPQAKQHARPHAKTAKTAQKAGSHKSTARAHQFSVKRPTAKLPKKFGSRR